MAKSIRVSDDMYELASNAGAVLHRSLAGQFEYWARLGAALDAAGISMDEAARLLQGDSQVKERILAVLGAAPLGREFKGAASIAKRKKLIEREVEEGRRSVDSLLLLDADRVRAATLTEREPVEAGQGW